MNGWLFPDLKCCVLPGQLHPIIAYLFNEWNCNLDCHYCWAFDNSVKGRNKVDDVRRLTEIAREYGIATDYHLNESPLIEQKHFKHCHTHCFSALNHHLGFCYNDARVIKWVLKQAAYSLQGMSGSFA